MIKHIKGDIFEQNADVICHQVNCQGVMGSGVAKQVREKYPWVYGTYKRMCDVYRRERKSLIGEVLQVFIDENRVILNIFGQEDFGYDGECYTDYAALKNCFVKINACYSYKVIAIPYLMGCHRGGGDWNVVYKMLEEIFSDSTNTLLICEYNGG